MKIYLIPLLFFCHLSYGLNHVELETQTSQLVAEFNQKSTDEKASYIKNNQALADINIIKYIYAQKLKTTNKIKSCQIFKELFNNQNFYFKDLAHLRIIETCIQKSSVDLKLIKPWMKKSLQHIQFNNCKLASSADCVDVYIKKSKNKLAQSEKISLISSALNKARNIKDKKRITQATKRLEKISPSFMTTVKKKDYLRVAKDFTKRRDFTNGHAYYQKVLDGKFSVNEKLAALLGLSKSFKLKRKYVAYVGELEKLHALALKNYKLKKPVISSKRFHKSCQDYSRASWSYVSRSKAITVLNECIELLKGKHSIAELYWVLGRIDEEKLNYEQAIEWFKKASQQKISRLDTKEKIYWYLAWNERKLKRYPSTIKTLKQLIKMTDSQFSKAKYQFWLANTHSKINEESKAKRIYQDIIFQTPMSYYSLLAHKFLNKKISYNTSKDSKVDTNKELHRKLNLNYVDWLILLDEIEIAKTYLKSNVKKHRSKFKEDDIKTVFHYYAKTELYLEFFYLVSILSPERQISLLNKHPELLFPQPYKKIVDEMATKYAFNSNIVYSIMRQESAFNPKARSFADAFGLLQLIPEVALRAQEKINLPYKTVEDLYDPKINVELGTYFLNQQWKLYNSQFILASASYNATDKAIKSWIKTRYKGNSIEFIEDIPYEETRNYVKLVMRNYIFYKLINSNKSIEFPNYCLDMDKKI